MRLEEGFVRDILVDLVKCWRLLWECLGVIGLRRRRCSSFEGWKFERRFDV
jgi:hypothetical protein